MSIIMILAPLALLLALAFMAAFLWATKSGQWDDLDLPPRKMLQEPTIKKDRDEHEDDEY